MRIFRDHSALKTTRWRPTVSFWIVASICALLLLLFAIAGGIAGVMILLGLIAVLTGLYSMVFKRRSWAGLPHRKAARVLAGGGVAMFILGGAVAGATASPVGDELEDASDLSTSSSSPSPTAEVSSLAMTPCDEESVSQKSAGEVFLCTENRAGQLVWLEEAVAEKLVAERAAEEQAAEAEAAAEEAAAERAAAEKAAAEKAAAQKAKAEADAAAKAAAEQAAVEQAAAEQEAARLAAEQEAARLAAEQEAARLAAEQAAAEQATVTNYVHPGSFCSGGTGVSKTGKPMVCAPASDGRLRWQSP